MLASGMTNSLKNLYNWTLRIAAHRRASWWLAGISFAQSAFFPVPADVALMPMCLADRGKSFRYATICTVSSVLGGLLGYAIGYFLFETAGKAIIRFYGFEDAFSTFKNNFNDWGNWIVFISGFSPIPYKVITIASGVTHMQLLPFVIASLVGRAVRFYFVAGLIWKYGTHVQGFIEKYLGWLTVLFFTLLIGGFIGLKYIL